MESHKERIRKLVELTNSEKRGMLFFLFLIVLILYLPKVVHRYLRDDLEMNGFQSQIDHFSEDRTEERTTPSRKELPIHSFDPNTVTVEELQAMGIPTFLAKRIESYRLSGGNFKRAEDLKKIYGFDEKLYVRVEAFVSIEKKTKTEEEAERKPSYHLNRPVVMDINTADSAELVKIRGIGPIYASRIVKYRTALGGFHDVMQVKEVYGINDSLFTNIQDNLFIDTLPLVTKIRINNVEIKELRTHPYFRSYKLCNALVKYRIQHGNYKSPEALRNVRLISDSVLNRITPYLSFE
ncbi:MAG TPA: hypothetical protein DCX54_00775 [Flavobacteriales bacterium]|nr:hypothetical protein [Flavobacteriales bacterium]